MSNDDTKRYGVVWHDDERGRWYTVVDRISGNHVHAFRNRQSAHSFAAQQNSMPMELRRQRMARESAIASAFTPPDPFSRKV